jgi:hypothetical protein
MYWPWESRGEESLIVKSLSPRPKPFLTISVAATADEDRAVWETRSSLTK